MLQVPDVLDTNQVARLREVLANAPFADGKRTAGAAARKVKSNEQAELRDEKVQEAEASVKQVLMGNDTFRAYARPVRWSRLLFSRYRGGDTYGAHVDDPLMQGEGGHRFRTDLSFTLFLSDPGTYEGGALVLEGRTIAHRIKLAAGSMMIYPSGRLHRVEPVTEGERLACVGWVQSALRREEQREALFDLGQVKGAVPEGDARLVLDKVMANLMRMWAEI